MKLMELEATLELNTTGFQTGVEDARAEMQGLKDGLTDVQTETTNTGSFLTQSLSHALGDFLSSITQAAIETAFDLVHDSVDLASSMEETNAKINTMFGESAQSIHRWARTTQESFGVGELTAKNYAAQVAGILSTDSKNLTTQEIIDLSTSLVELSGDLASFHNMSFDDVFGKLLSGLRGETEAIEALGIDLRVTNLASAFNMSSKEWDELDQRTRLLNTYQYIMKETAIAQGDFARTSDNYANQLRLLDQNIVQLKTSLGDSILPVMTDLVSWFNSMFGSQEKAAEGAALLVEAYDDNLVSIENTATNALALVNALDELASASEDAASTELWKSVLQELEETLPGLSSLIDSNSGAIEGGTAALKEYVNQWRETSKELAQMKVMEEMLTMADTLEAEIAKLQMEEQVAEIRKSGAKEAMANIGGELLNYMLAGMENMGASNADIEAMQKFGTTGAAGLLSRMAGGGDPQMIMNALLQGGDLWKNKSFMDYFIAGGGNARTLEMLAELYGAQAETYNRYDVDNDMAISDKTTALGYLNEEIAIMQSLLQSEDEESAAETAKDVGENVGEAVVEAIEETKPSKKTETGLQSYEQTGVSAEPQGTADMMSALQTLVTALSTIKADVSAGAREGCAAGVGQITVTGSITTGNVMLNTGALVGQLTPRLNMSLARG